MALELMRRPWTGSELAREFVPLRTMMDRLLETAFTPSFFFGGLDGVAGTAVDVYETDEAYIVQCLLPGIDPEQVHVAVQDNVLTISGERRPVAPEGAQPIFQEIGTGRFERQLTLGVPVDASKAEATYEGGILSITLPKAEAVKAKTIKVKKA